MPGAIIVPILCKEFAVTLFLNRNYIKLSFLTFIFLFLFYFILVSMMMFNNLKMHYIQIIPSYEKNTG